MDLSWLPVLGLGGGLAHAVEVWRQLESLGLRPVAGGDLLVNGVPVVGKGTNSVVVLCISPTGAKLACKLRRADAGRPSLAWEGAMLAAANAVGVGPRLYAYSRDLVAYRFVEGVPIRRWWASAAPEERRRLAAALLEQAYALDTAGISHNELTRLDGHVLVEGGAPVIIDFESATLGGASNVTQVAEGLRRLGLGLPLEVLRLYKRCRCREALEGLLGAVGAEGPGAAGRP